MGAQGGRQRLQRRRRDLGHGAVERGARTRAQVLQVDAGEHQHMVGQKRRRVGERRRVAGGVRAGRTKPQGRRRGRRARTRPPPRRPSPAGRPETTTPGPGGRQARWRCARMPGRGQRTPRAPGTSSDRTGWRRRCGTPTRRERYGSALPCRTGSFGPGAPRARAQDTPPSPSAWASQPASSSAARGATCENGGSKNSERSPASRATSSSPTSARSAHEQNAQSAWYAWAVSTVMASSATGCASIAPSSLSCVPRPCGPCGRAWPRDPPSCGTPLVLSCGMPPPAAPSRGGGLVG